ncbi:MAG: RNA chaperone Hfq [Proteobacteria bacterium]|jgi:host factor-I protein|nr:RNA chaperone Hfq [Pseudomonadota bacterium]
MNRINIQDQFLNQVRRDKLKVTVELLSGNRLEGVRVISFDNFCLLLDKPEPENTQVLVYKHAVASIRPAPGLRLRLSLAPPEKEGFHNQPRFSGKPPEGQSQGT